MSKLVIDILDPTKFIKVNDLQPVTNPIFFNRNNDPTPDGLLSNEIFGITSVQRRETFGYIDLHDYFIHPLYYKMMGKVDRRFKDCVHGIKEFKISSSGELVEVESGGDNGIEFIRKNISKIKFKSSESVKIKEYIDFLNANKDVAFMKELIVIPALYRDVQTTNGKTGVGEINTLYMNILISVKSLSEASELGFSLSSATRGRIQELLLSVYDWFGSGTTVGSMETSGVLPGKLGLIRRAGTGKTADNAGRNVITMPDNSQDYMEDYMVDVTHAALPLSTVCVNFRQYIIFHVRRIIDNIFGGDKSYTYIDKDTGKRYKMLLKDPEIVFSDKRINEEIDRFIKGYSNRLIPIEVPVLEKTKKPIYMHFIGRRCTQKEYEEHLKNGSLLDVPILDRKMTWCDMFYIAAMQFIEEKTVLLTRFPIDSYYNQFPQQIRVSSTNETEPMIIFDKLIKHYPKIRNEDIGSNTSSMFIDSVQMSNANIGPIGGDYDGDTVSDKGVFSIEANEELREFMNSKAFYVNLGGNCVRGMSKDAIQSIYCLTRVLPGTKLSEME